MIKANELRIDNWVFHNGKEMQVGGIDSSIDGNAILVLNRDSQSYLMSFENDGDLQPIPLTPEILQKCGFKTEGFRFASNSGHIGSVYYIMGVDSIEVCVFDDSRDIHLISGSFVISPKVTSLHQLQNLYFALTGTELEYKP